MPLRVFSPISPGLAGRRDDPAGIRRPLRTTPMCDGHGQCWPRVPERLPLDALAHGPGDKRRHTPAPAGRGRYDGCRQAARGGASCRCRAPCAADTGGWRHAAWRCCTMVSATLRRSASSSERRARSTAMLVCPAGAAQRAATPLRLALSAMCVPRAGKGDGLLVLCTGARRSPRVCARACGAGGGRGSRASRRERRMPAGACRRGAGRQSLRVDRVMCGLAAMDGLHGEGMTEDDRDRCIGAEVGEPVPGEQACDRDDASQADTEQ